MATRLHGRAVDRLASLSPSQRTTQLLEWLPRFRRAGWMTADTRSRYETLAREGGLPAVTSSLDGDLAAGRITSEVAAIVRAVAGR